MKGYIYKITNTINGKAYIGQTRYSIEQRWEQHQHTTVNTHFKRAIDKYGSDAFIVEELEQCDYSELDAREIYYIAKYNTYFNGYNSTLGNITSVKQIWAVDNKYEEICSLYEHGLSAYKIASLYNLDKAVILKILKAVGIEIRKSYSIELNDDEFKELVIDYQHGYSLKTLAKRYNCSSSELKGYLLSHGVDLRIKYSILDNEEEQQAMINDYLDNDTTLKQILKKYHCEYATFCKVLAIHGISKGKKHFKIAHEKYIEVIRLFNNGWSVPQIAKEYEVDKATIYTLLKSAGFKFEGTLPLLFDNETITNIINDYKNGCSLNNLARHYGCSRKGITNILKKNKVEMRIKYNLLKDKEMQKSLIEDYLYSDITVRELLIKYHCNHTSMIRVLNENNIDHSKQRYKISEEGCQECIKAFKSGKTVKQISKEVNIPTS